MNGSSLLVNLVLALGAAAIGAALSVRLGQSVILGYILAGIAIGPFTPGFVGDLPSVQAVADIGVIFLMFAIGVQFSFKDLLAVGRIAIIGGTIQVVLMIGIGYLVGVAIGWTPLEALFLGCVISNSSSTVLTKVLGERGQLGTEYGKISLAWSSVQDLGTVILVVVLSALSAGDGSFLSTLFTTILTAGAFLAVLGIVGTFVLPRFFEMVTRLRNREVFILTVVAVALGTAYASSFFGLSLALGAFVAGVVIGESDLSYHILGEIAPLRDVFAGLFFVSIGMLVNPAFVASNIGLVLLTLALIVVVKGALSTAITLVAGYTPRIAVYTGITLGQSAEFSFLLASLGATLGVLGPSSFSLLLAGAGLSIILAPTVQRLGDPLTRAVEGLLPAPRLARLDTPDSSDVGGRALPRGHAIICGYGRVGRVVGESLRRRDFSIVVIEEDARIVRALRKQGIPALLGNAGNSLLLDTAGLLTARVLIIAIPDVLASRQAVEYAKRVNPRLDVVVRTVGSSELRFMRERGVAEAVVGETELALEMTRHTLRRFGISAIESLAIVQRLRERLEANGERRAAED